MLKIMEVLFFDACRRESKPCHETNEMIFFFFSLRLCYSNTYCCDQFGGV